MAIIAVLEYASDLEDYPAESYQFPITYQQNCQVAKELFSFMASSRQSDRSGTSSLLGRFRFVSNKNVLTLAATLGLYEVSGFKIRNLNSWRIVYYPWMTMFYESVFIL